MTITAFGVAERPSPGEVQGKARVEFPSKRSAVGCSSGRNGGVRCWDADVSGRLKGSRRCHRQGRGTSGLEPVKEAKESLQGHILLEIAPDQDGSSGKCAGAGGPLPSRSACAEDVDAQQYRDREENTDCDSRMNEMPCTPERQDLFDWYWWPWDWWADGVTSEDTLLTSKYRVGDTLACDETQLGPDGDVYEIFYPQECGAPVVDDFLPHSPSEVPVKASHLSATSGLSNQTSAEACITDLMGMMHRVMAERHPARAQLFEAAHAAAETALGEHFWRLALVGSTALRIDTPASDLDAVAFTCTAAGRPPLCPVEALRRVGAALGRKDTSLRIELIDCTRVPVLVVWTADGELSLDLTIDQPLPELHVIWFQSQQAAPVTFPAPLHGVPTPAHWDEGDQGLEAAALRCVKWWLRRRRVPTTKEGGYPSLVWTLMVLHVLRCSVFVDEASSRRDSLEGIDAYSTAGRALLRALAVFFDRYSEQRGLSGTMIFAGGTHAEFWPQQPPGDYEAHGFGASAPGFPGWAELSVLDPTTTTPLALGDELAPRTSPATQLLQVYELWRAQNLSAIALETMDCTNTSQPAALGEQVLSELFAEVDANLNMLPTVAPSKPTCMLLLREGTLRLGLLHSVRPKPRWTAPFLHRRDAHSRITVQLCEVDEFTGDTRLKGSRLEAYSPEEFVCLGSLDTHGGRSAGSDDPMEKPLRLDREGLERWIGMRGLLAAEPSFPLSASGGVRAVATPQSGGSRGRGARRSHRRASGTTHWGSTKHRV